jgi:hypothetical protein
MDFRQKRKRIQKKLKKHVYDIQNCKNIEKWFKYSVNMNEAILLSKKRKMKYLTQPVEETKEEKIHDYRITHEYEIIERIVPGRSPILISMKKINTKIQRR